MSKKKRRLFQFVITLIFIALGVFAMGRLKSSKPQLERHTPSVPVPAVKTVKVKTGPQPVVIRGEGTVRPLKEIRLVPQVGGKVVYMSPSLVNGGVFKKGDTLLRIDPMDYKLAVTLAEAKVKDADSKLEFVVEEAAAALEEWHLYHNGGRNSGRKPPALVAKKPQLAAAQARLEADRADLKRAQLNLERTELKAPFYGRVSQETVDTGQYVSPGQALATLYSTGAVEIILPMENKDLFWFHVPGFTSGNGPDSKAVVRAHIAGLERTWPGKVVRAEGKLDERTRMINVVVRVKRPYAKRPPLAIGLFVTVDITGRFLSKAAIIPQIALRQDNIVWVVKEDGRLHFRKVDIARFQGETVLIKSGLKQGEMVVTSSLKVVSDGMNVRVISAKEGDLS